jgi:dTDP-6-deoxy-L-talose 4-dehydrogenase (NAD+)
MKILVTGGAGFIGARAAAQLVEGGHDVALLLRPGTSTRRIDALLRHLRIVWSDLATLEGAHEAIALFGAECCLHLAWYAEPGKYLDSERNFDSLGHTIALLRFLAERGCRSFVMAGTCAEYVPSTALLREDSPVEPTTLYAAAKLAALHLGQQYARLRSLQLAWGRVFLLYGSGEDARRAIPAAIRILRSGGHFDATAGTQLRDFLHVDDVAAGFVRLCEARASGVFNICSGIGRTMREIFELIQAKLGLQDRIHFGAVKPRDWEPPAIVGDNRKLCALGWNPRYSLEEGLEAVIRTAK